MPNQVTIVMYHFVRNLKYSRYPAIKGLTLREFKEQLAYLQRHYYFVKIEDCLNAMYFNEELPANSVLLTFDDAYIDHYVNIFPLLDEKGIQGSFFPPAKAIMNNEVLDVNKIHFVLAAASCLDIINDIKDYLYSLKNEYDLYNFDYYFTKLAHANRFDAKEVIFIKRLLQSELDMEIRSTITNRLFMKYVTKDEASFARELYMNTDQLMCMVRNDMYVGGHGYDHFWLNTLTPEEQTKEISLTIEFLNLINAPIDSWVMCYPYGSYDHSLIKILRNNNCKAALTTKVGIAQLTQENAYSLERLDTNDLPKYASANSNDWTRQVSPV